jgi:CRISPR-associated endonuclease/helicase Cas3
MIRTGYTQTMTDPPMLLPPGRFWAKWDAATGNWHPLAAHCADVAAVMANLLAPGSTLSDRLAGALGERTLHPAHRAAIVYLTALHDIGKVNHGFQSKNRPPGQRGPWRSRGHVKPLLRSLEIRPVEAVIRAALAVVPADEADAYELFRTALCHHGRPWSDDGDDFSLRRLWVADAERDPVAGMHELIGCARRWSGIDAFPNSPPLRPTPGFTHLLAGAVMLADWIGSTEEIFPLCADADQDIGGYWGDALDHAARACRGIGVVPTAVLRVGEGEALLRQMFPTVFGLDAGSPARPTALQRCAATMNLPPAGSRILVESETGSGKTEAALVLYARLRAAGLVGGLMFALPTRATATAMYRRVGDALQTIYPPDEQPSVALAVGGRQPHLQANVGIVEREPAPPLDPEDDLPEFAGWASDSAKRYLAAEIVVGTLDQVLLAGMAVRHAHLRLAALSRHLLVVDELHSFDRYMATVLERLLSLFTAAGGTALFMSATLSDAERQRFGGDGAVGSDVAEAARRSYPLLSLRRPADPDWRAIPLDEHVSAAKRVAWKRVAEEAVAATAVAAAQAGARVCVLRNTVGGARSTHQAIADLEGADWLWSPPESSHAPPYHSRYTLYDRVALDDAVLKRFGKESPPGRGVVLVATQVVEQSLDVDFDLLVTDLCPVDVLLQRIGRLHRHRPRDSHRPAEFRVARCHVIAPAEGVEQYRKVKFGQPNGIGTVYSDLTDLHLTLGELDHRREIEIPAQNRELIEAVYHPAHREGLASDPDWSDYIDKQDGAQRGQEYHAKSASLDLDMGYVSNAERYQDEKLRQIRTRLGDESIRIELPGPIPAWYAPPEPSQSWADLPLHALTREGMDLLSASERVVEELRINAAGETEFRLGGREYRYTPSGWQWS